MACSEQEGEVVIRLFIGRITRAAEAKGYHREGEGTEGENGEPRNSGTQEQRRCCAVKKKMSGGVVWLVGWLVG